MYMDYIQNFKNINKRTGKSVQQNYSGTQETNLENSRNSYHNI